MDADGADVQNLIVVAADLVASYVSNNHVAPGELPGLIASTYAAVAGIAQPAAAESPDEKATPAQIRKSITHDALISFVDGKSYKTLKKHLTRNGLTIESYRERFGLPSNYPSTAAAYSAQRSELARVIGLGRQRKNAQPVSEAVPEMELGPKRRGRPRKVAEQA